jgi:hypothetical protein
MELLKIYSVIVMGLVCFVLFDNYVKSKNKVDLISFTCILPIIFYILLR